MVSRLEDAEVSSAEVQQAVHEDFLHFTATLIQSSYRGYALRKSYNVLVSCLHHVYQDSLPPYPEPSTRAAVVPQIVVKMSWFAEAAK